MSDQSVQANNRYTDHEHDWKVDYNVGGLFSVSCTQCPIMIELYSDYVALADYSTFSRKTIQYDQLTQVVK